MKCICGYEHESGVDENGKWNDFLKGDEEFILIIGNFFKTTPFSCDEIRVALYSCPKCKIIQLKD